MEDHVSSRNDAEKEARNGRCTQRIATTIRFADSPRMKLTLGSNLRESDIQEGRDVYLDCKIRANPVTSEVIWEFEGQELQTDKNKGEASTSVLLGVRTTVRCI